MGARWYDAALGRWTAADTIVPNPSDPQSFNRYSYCLANPLKFRDPTGHLAEGEDDEGDLDLTLELLALGEEDLYWYLHNTNSELEILGFAATGLVLVAAGPFIGTMTVSAAEALLASGTAVTVGKAVVEEAIESGVTGRPFDPINVLLDAGTQIADEAYTIWKYGDDAVCFAAGTLVATQEGQVPIESVREGDFVYALNSPMSSSGLFTVTHVFSHHVTSLFKVGIGDDEIHVTEEHPFWVVGKGWRSAKSLVQGDCIQTRVSGCLPVVSVHHIPADMWVYNLTVADAHTYFVGDSEYLVHNQCRRDRAKRDYRQQKLKARKVEGRQGALPKALNVDESDLKWRAYDHPETVQQTMLGLEDRGPRPRPRTASEWIAWALEGFGALFGGSD